MSATTHTPGPWFINGPYDFESDLFIRATIDGENYDVASLYDDETGQFKANAALISAAPELREALQNTWEHLFATGKINELPDALVEQIESTLRKANNGH